MSDSTKGIDDDAGRSDALLRLLCSQRAVRAGEFTLRSGRPGRYFVDFAAAHSAATAAVLGAIYAAAVHHRVLVDTALRDTAQRDGRLPFVLFGPAYKGIPLAVATSIALLTQYGCDADWAFNRKVAKAHGEGGALIGASVGGRRVLLLDDVFTDGSASGEALALVSAHGGEPLGLLVGLDRQERSLGAGESTSAASWRARTGLPIWAVSDRAALLAWLRDAVSRGEPRGELLAAVSGANTSAAAIGSVAALRRSGAPGDA